MFSYVSFVFFMKCLYVLLSNNLLWQYSPNKLANMYKQMLLAFPPFIILSLSSNPFLRGSQWQSNIVPISQNQSNMNANLEWLMHYKQNNQRRTENNKNKDSIPYRPICSSIGKWMKYLRINQLAKSYQTLNKINR